MKMMMMMVRMYNTFCRLMSKRIEVADPRIFLIYAAYVHIIIYTMKWSMNIIMNNIQQADA